VTEVVDYQAAKNVAERPIVWFLSGPLSSSEPTRHIPIQASPFRVGRQHDLEICIEHPTVSACHAEIIEQDNALVIHDLQSTNGTYVNGARLHHSATAQEDDLIQFAEVAFKVRKQDSHADQGTVLYDNMRDMALGLVQFDKLMSEQAVTPFYQPIVCLQDTQTIGYEVLGRSHVMGLETPAAMFHAASQLNLEVELSRMFRWEGINHSNMLPKPFHLFFNTHPRELTDPGLISSLESLRTASPSGEITLEIHEAAVPPNRSMRELKAHLGRMNIHLAYDDFRSGQTRLTELLEVKPDFLKFGMACIRDIHTAPQKRQQTLSRMVHTVRDQGVIPIATGVETDAESATCRQLGFELAQGFLFGRPAAAKSVPGAA